MAVHTVRVVAIVAGTAKYVERSMEDVVSVDLTNATLIAVTQEHVQEVSFLNNIELMYHKSIT